MKRLAPLAWILLFGLAAASACAPSNGRRSVGGSGAGNPAPPDMARDPSTDYDNDGYTEQQGDCNEDSSLVNPGSMEDGTNGVDDDCDGTIDESTDDCDTGLLNKTDADSLVSAVGQCDPQFINTTGFKGPSAVAARKVVKKFGIIQPISGDSMVLLSTGNAAAKGEAGYTEPQTGTDLGDSNEYANPDPSIVPAPGCGMSQPAMVNDYTEWVLKLKAPTNAFSFSFDFQFFSAEYPEFVCTSFNDEFLVMMESANEFQTAKNISFDMQGNPVTVNNGFFTVCKNNTSKPQTQNCTKPVSEIAGTGYEDVSFGSDPIGGATGWLKTTAPVTPGEDITLRFIIFDEGDHIYDSAVLIDNLKWSVNAIEGPITIQ